MNELNGQQFVGFVRAICDAMDAARDELNTLDLALGDGDHGTSLSAAFGDAIEKVTALSQPTPAAVLQITAQSLLNRMGGASGALYGTLFLRASLAAQGKPTLSHEDIKRMWQAGLEGVLQRGKAQPGDKTMIDALQPAVEAFASGQDFRESFDLAATAAAEGARKTATMIARHGRAKFAGERAIGHVDAGASSIAILFAALKAYWKEQRDGET